MSRPPCAACGAQTQLIFIRDVELDACTVCQGLWFDEGELEKVSGERPRFSPLSGGSGRDCPRCAFRMRSGLIQRNLHVENCRPCEGYYLDAGELERLVQEELEVFIPGSHAPPPEPVVVAPPDPRVAAPAVAAASTTAPQPPSDRVASQPPPQAPSDFWGTPTGQSGFECIVCNARFPMTDGNFYRGALACRGCTPQVQTTRSERAAGNGNYEESWDATPIGRIAKLLGVYSLSGAAIRGTRRRWW
ncbi:MAG TPA: zf-TFIIB domain-containing protein [Myxococcaceae bacterium]|nr:zf-TFIIB domain-containing protein [Myxococcaceae bacterium]